MTVTPQYCNVMDAPKVENEVSVKPADLDEYISRIETRIETYEKKYNEAPNSSKLKPVFLKTLEGLQAQLVNLMAPPTQNSLSTPAPGESLHSKNISEALRRVKPFAGQDLEKTPEFLDKLQQIFDIEVTRPDPEGSLDLESIFMRKVLSSVIENRVYKHIEAAGQIDKVTKWSDFKTYVTQNFTPKQNAVQVTCKLFDVVWDRSSSETLHIPAGKIAEKVKNGWSALNRQWKEKKSVETDIPGEDVFRFFGACHLSELIKQQEFDTHRDMIRDLDEVFNVSDVANKGEYYRVRLKDKTGTSVYHTRNEPRQNFKPKSGYGNRDNRQNRSKGKPEVTKEKPEVKPEGKKSKPNRDSDSESDSENKEASVRYVQPMDWTTRSYHLRVSKSTPENATESSKKTSKDPNTLVPGTSRGTNGPKRKGNKKKSKGNRKGTFRRKPSQTKETANMFTIYKVDGEGQQGNRFHQSRPDPYLPGVSRICWTCAEVPDLCKCDEESDNDQSPANIDAVPAKSRPTSPVNIPTNWTKVFQ